jgi:putative transposase
MMATAPPYAGYRFPAAIIGHAVWLYVRFPFGRAWLRNCRPRAGIIVSHEIVGRWALKFGQTFAENRSSLTARGRQMKRRMMRQRE